MALLKDINEFEPQIKRMTLDEDWNSILFDFGGSNGFNVVGVVMSIAKLKSMRSDILSIDSESPELLELYNPYKTIGRYIWTLIEDSFIESEDEDTLITIEITMNGQKITDIDCFPHLLDSKLDVFKDVGEFADSMILTDDIDIDYLKFFFKL